ncbi:hypothetical protein FN924_13900 [Radiobacillus deserti]|uniref:Uncharacterized protein n=1 Tax=Radiobacillus deserti TaxID=2594883 RepID=A0A516KIG7_9BACI|nr:hypothetical protein FN924_13900 [Radiobacillus deserti]
MEAPKKVLSLYLNTGLSQSNQQDGEIRLKNRFKKLEEYIESLQKAVETEIYNNERDFSRSMMIFATDDQEVWFAEKLSHTTY